MLIYTYEFTVELLCFVHVAHPPELEDIVVLLVDEGILRLIRLAIS